MQLSLSGHLALALHKHYNAVYPEPELSCTMFNVCQPASHQTDLG